MTDHDDGALRAHYADARQARPTTDDIHRVLARARTAEPTARRRGIALRRPVLALAAVAVTAGLAVTLVDLDTGRPEPVTAASAAAALDPGRDVVHVVLVGGPVDDRGRPSQEALSIDGRRQVGLFERRIEQWSSARPLRFRSTRRLRAPNGSPIGTVDDGIAPGPILWSDMSWDGRPARTSTLKEAAPYGDGANVGAFGAPDPTAQIRSGLRAGRFRVAGTTTVDGRDATRLVADTVLQDGSEVEVVGGGQGVTVRQRQDYLVDSRTRAPIALDTYERISGPSVRAADSRYRPTARLRVTRYERLSPDDVPARIFAVPGSTGGRP